MNRIRGGPSTSPTLAMVARHAGPRIIEATVVPLAVFTVLVHTVGIQPALWGSLGVSYAALVRRVVTGRRLPGILVLSAIGMTFKLVTLVYTASAFLFFAQPVLATAATALVFFASTLAGRPLAARLGADLVPLPDRAWSEPEVQRVCSRLSVMWGVALSANATLTLWMLSNLSVSTFVLLRPLVGVSTTIPAIVASVCAGRAVLRRCGASLLSGEPAASAPALAQPVGLAVV